MLAHQLLKASRTKSYLAQNVVEKDLSVDANKSWEILNTLHGLLHIVYVSTLSYRVNKLTLQTMQMFKQLVLDFSAGIHPIKTQILYSNINDIVNLIKTVLLDVCDQICDSFEETEILQVRLQEIESKLAEYMTEKKGLTKCLEEFYIEPEITKAVSFLGKRKAEDGKENESRKFRLTLERSKSSDSFSSSSNIEYPPYGQRYETSLYEIERELSAWLAECLNNLQYLDFRADTREAAWLALQSILYIFSKLQTDYYKFDENHPPEVQSNIIPDNLSWSLPQQQPITSLDLDRTPTVNHVQSIVIPKFLKFLNDQNEEFDRLLLE